MTRENPSMTVTDQSRAVLTFDLTPEEAGAVRRCAETFAPGAAVDDVLDTARVHAAELPRRLRAFAEEFRLAENAGAVLVRGLPVDPRRVGPTPLTVDVAPEGTATEDRMLVLLSTLLGDVFGWAAEYGGRVVHDLVPLPGHETDQSGTSSDTVLGWHTDEAYHPMRADYLVLLCIRNPDDVPTSVSVPDVDNLSPAARELLLSRPFRIAAESSHAPEHEPGAAGGDWADVRLLFGHPDDPYVIFDAGYTDLSDADPAAQAAFDEFRRSCDTGSTASLALQPGDLLMVDNLRCVHSRGSFSARYDGTDRWLKRTYVTRDLRKSRAARHHASSRTVA
jgi:Fe(II)/alpha-ketoglutarate-dependent arginine beta-hydroxylase